MWQRSNLLWQQLHGALGETNTETNWRTVKVCIATIHYNDYIINKARRTTSTQLNSTQPEITDAGVWHLYVRIINNKTIL